MRGRWLPALCLALALAGVGCGREAQSPAGIQTRVFVDRTEARVGDPIGVTVEIETPAGFGIEPPAAPPPSSGFVTEAVQELESIRAPAGLRHRVLWTLRARAVGDHVLPELRVPLVRPDGSIQPLPAGGMPLAVRSVRSELPEQTVFFDIRPPPPPERAYSALWIGTGVIAALGLLGWLAVRQRGAVAKRTAPDPRALARRSIAALEAAFDEPHARVLAGRLAAPVWRFVEERWAFPARAATPSELPPSVDAELVGALRELEHARFRRHPERAQVLAGGERARVFFRSFAGDVDDA